MRTRPRHSLPTLLGSGFGSEVRTASSRALLLFDQGRWRGDDPPASEKAREEIRRSAPPPALDARPIRGREPRPATGV